MSLFETSQLKNEDILHALVWLHRCDDDKAVTALKNTEDASLSLYSTLRRVQYTKKSLSKFMHSTVGISERFAGANFFVRFAQYLFHLRKFLLILLFIRTKNNNHANQMPWAVLFRKHTVMCYYSTGSMDKLVFYRIVRWCDRHDTGEVSVRE